MTRTIATLSPSLPRRVVATVVLALLGLFLIRVAAGQETGAAMPRVLLAVMGAAAVILSGVLWRASDGAIILTEAGLFDAKGREICGIDEMTGIDRGTFAIKPSNGFVIRLARPAPRGWAPGLWWRVGTRLGVGGVIAAVEARRFAELLGEMIAARSAE